MKFADPNARLHASSNVILRVKPWMAWFIEISKRTGGGGTDWDRVRVTGGYKKGLRQLEFRDRCMYTAYVMLR